MARLVLIWPEQHVGHACCAVVGNLGVASGNAEQSMMELTMSIYDGESTAEKISTRGSFGQFCQSALGVTLVASSEGNDV